MKRFIWTVITVIAMFEFLVGAVVVDGGQYLIGTLIMAASLSWMGLTLYQFGR